LLRAHRATGETEFREVAIAAGRGMLSDFVVATQHGSAAIHPILGLPEKRPLAWEHRWSRSPGCYQLKAALAWWELFEATGDREFECGYEGALTAALADDRAFLEADPDPLLIMDRLHAYGYFLEGLLPVLDRENCRQAFRDGLDRAGRLLRDIAPVFARSDVYAQILRARLTSGLAIDEAAAAHEAEQAAGFQIESPYSHLPGGFLFGRKHGEPLPFVNPVSTAFCAQALALWNDRSTPRSTQLDTKRDVI
jgi:hypothetical protein